MGSQAKYIFGDLEGHRSHVIEKWKTDGYDQTFGKALKEARFYF